MSDSHQHDVLIIEILQNWQEPFMNSYFKNHADQAAVVRIWFWIKVGNCETILFKMVQFIESV